MLCDPIESLLTFLVCFYVLPYYQQGLGLTFTFFQFFFVLVNFSFFNFSPLLPELFQIVFITLSDSLLAANIRVDTDYISGCFYATGLLFLF